MFANHSGIDIRLGLILLGAALAGDHTARGDLTGQMQEILGGDLQSITHLAERPPPKWPGRALALVRVLAGDDVRHQSGVGIENHPRVARQGRSPLGAQWRQTLLAGRGVPSTIRSDQPGRLSLWPTTAITGRRRVALPCTSGSE